MALDIFYTPRAKETFGLVYYFISEKFGVKAANRFLNKAEKIIDLLSQQPFMYKSSSIDVNVRIANFSKYTSLFYQVSGNKINLLFFFDNRQQPLF